MFWHLFVGDVTAAVYKYTIIILEYYNTFCWSSACRWSSDIFVSWLTLFTFMRKQNRNKVFWYFSNVSQTTSSLLEFLDTVLIVIWSHISIAVIEPIQVSIRRSFHSHFISKKYLSESQRIMKTEILSCDKKYDSGFWHNDVSCCFATD